MSIDNSIESLTKGVLLHGPEILEKCISSDPALEKYFKRISEEFLNYPIPRKSFDKITWNIPEDYLSIDIEEYLVSICPKENYDRLIEELILYQKNNMLPLLKVMKYVVDTLKSNNIVWGVGRGSSVASYVLFLLGVHRIDSVKYKLPIEEFFKGEQNG
jgi:DNA polymerase III alpha subunit